MGCPQITRWSPSRCLSPPRMHSIDIKPLCPISDFALYSGPKVIDTFAPRRDMSELSPTSSMSSSDTSDSSLRFSPEDAFFATRSRVVRVSGVFSGVCCPVADALQLYNLPAMAESFLTGVFLPHNVRHFLLFYHPYLHFKMVTDSPRVDVGARSWTTRQRMGRVPNSRRGKAKIQIDVT